MESAPNYMYAPPDDSHMKVTGVPIRYFESNPYM